jgi:16S rRNA C1402 (ribose-2'-O) methylase RsmI
MVVAFEAPHRIARTISDIAIISVKQPMLVLREISKINYALVEWSINKPGDEIKQLGEFVIVVPPRGQASISDEMAAEAFNLFCCMTEKCGVEPRVASMAAGVALDIQAEAVDTAIRFGRKLAKRQKMTNA